jgi:hypothetical protein
VQGLKLTGIDLAINRLSFSFCASTFLRRLSLRTFQISLTLFIIVCSLQPGRAAATVTVKNELDMARPSQTIDLKWSDVAAALPDVKPDRVVVTDSDGKQVVAQPIWLQPSKKKPADEFVFQADFAPNQTRSFTLAAGVPAPYDPKVYGRWVPERHDDFAWENDRIAFRSYGPDLEKVEPACSGVDVWPKRTRSLRRASTMVIITPITATGSTITKSATAKAAVERRSCWMASV